MIHTELQSTIENLKISNLNFSVARLIKKDKLQHSKSRKGQKKNSMIGKGNSK